MLKRINHKHLGRGLHDWLDSHFHFSFADYYNPDNIHFGELRVINDDLVKVGTGFDTHYHRDMEIISYVVDGELTHQDSIGNKHTLKRGEVQYMSAGTGVLHSEHNYGNKLLRFLQIWIMPDKEGYAPNYGDYRFSWEERKNKWLKIVSNSKNEAPIQLHQDIEMSAVELDEGQTITYDLNKDRQAYLVLIEGEATINSIELEERDGLEAIEEDLEIKATQKSHILLIEMAKPEELIS